MNIDTDEFYNEIKGKLGTQALFSFQSDVRLYGRDAIEMIIKLYTNKLCEDIINEIREGNLDSIDDVERELIYNITQW